MRLDPGSKVTPEQLALARAAIDRHCGGPWKPHAGQVSQTGLVDCPVCLVPKMLRYYRAGLTGQTVAVCLTPECIAWRETD